MSRTGPPTRHQVPPDDAMLGRAFRRSIAVLFLIGAVVAGVSFFIESRQGPPRKQDPAAPAAADTPLARFTDVTREAGIAFVHTNGAYGDKLLPETMGGGVAFFDFDGDGDADLLFVNSSHWPWKPPAGGRPPTAALYRNDGTGRFTDVTAGSGLDESLYAMGTATGDYDNDGAVDVFITAVGGNRLFHNDGNGKFSNVTERAGVGGATNDWSTSAAWIDYDNDGSLDLFVCNYVRWSREIDFQVDNRLAGGGRVYGRPMNFPGSFPRLYRKAGNGRFTDVSAASGIQVANRSTGQPMAKSLGVAPVDWDHDGWIDLIVANDTVQNFLFANQRNGTFKEVGAVSGIAFDNFGGPRGAMGIDAARFQADDAIGVSIGNFANEMTALYVSQREALTFADEAIVQGIGDASRNSLTFGVFFFDYDLDGWLDLLTANGHIEEDIQQSQPGQKYRQSAQLFWNARGSHKDGGFVLAPPEKCGPDLLKPIVGRGSAFADIDGDGDLDVVLTQINGPALLLRNDQQLGHRWVRFKLVGAKSNRDAIGAWVKARVGSQVYWRQVMPARGYLSQSELPVTFGLGDADRVDELTVIWPDGSSQSVTSIRLNELNVVHQPR